MKKGKESDQIPLQGSEEAEILNRLSDRVERVVQTISELRRERDELRAKLERVESDLREQEESAGRLTELEEENSRFREERDLIRSRIERMLENLEGLEEA